MLYFQFKKVFVAGNNVVNILHSAQNLCTVQNIYHIITKKNAVQCSLLQYIAFNVLCNTVE